MRRLWDVALFAFGPLKRTGSVLAWWPPVIAILGVAAAAVGVSIPDKVGGHWLAMGGLALLCGMSLVAVYRIHRVAYPDFPPHYVHFGNPMYVERDPNGPDAFEDMLLFDVTFQSRHRRRMAVEFRLFWQMTWKSDEEGESVLGPFSGRAEKGPLGRLDVLKQPIELDPDGRGEGLLAFTVGPMVGIEPGNHGDVVVAEGASLFVRLIDHVSGAEIEEPLEARPLVTPKEKQAGGT